MKRIILFLCVLVFSLFSNTNNLLAKEIENNIKENVSSEIEEIKLNFFNFARNILFNVIFNFFC